MILKMIQLPQLPRAHLRTWQKIPQVWGESNRCLGASQTIYWELFCLLCEGISTKSTKIAYMTLLRTTFKREAGNVPHSPRSMSWTSKGPIAYSIMSRFEPLPHLCPEATRPLGGTLPLIRLKKAYSEHEAWNLAPRQRSNLAHSLPRVRQ